MSARRHIIEVEKINSIERATASVTVDVSERVVSFTNVQCTYTIIIDFMYIPYFLVDVDQVLQNYVFTFTLTGEPSDMIRINFFIDSNLSSVLNSCNSKTHLCMDISSDKFCILGIVNTNYGCSFILSESSGVSVGYHNITIQALRDEIIYGEITERFFVFISTCFIKLCTW